MIAAVYRGPAVLAPDSTALLWSVLPAGAPGCLALMLRPLLFPPKLLTVPAVPDGTRAGLIAQALRCVLGIMWSCRSECCWVQMTETEASQCRDGQDGWGLLAPSRGAPAGLGAGLPAGPQEAALCHGLLSVPSSSDGFPWGPGQCPADRMSPVMRSHRTLLEPGAGVLTGPLRAGRGVGVTLREPCR